MPGLREILLILSSAGLLALALKLLGVSRLDWSLTLLALAVPASLFGVRQVALRRFLVTVGDSQD